MTTENNSKIILDLCGGTGSWSEPYKKAGYEVHLITWPDYDISWKWATHKEIIFYGQKDTPKLAIDPSRVYGILAAPPCTMFSRARTNASTPRDFAGAIEVVNACLEIVHVCRSSENSQLKFWALENPMGYLRQFLGNPPHSFRGWEWGDDHVKFTDLWGYYTMPAPIAKIPRRWNYKGFASPKKPEKYAHLKLTRADIRSITPPHFARAFMEANK